MRKDIVIGWDVSGLPANATVTNVTVTGYLKTPAAVTWVANVTDVSQTGEAWTEAGVKCSNKPGGGGNISDTVIIGTVAGPMTLLSGAFGAAVMASRTNGTTFSILLLSTAAAGTGTFQSKDSGGTPGNASGPVLTITFTTP